MNVVVGHNRSNDQCLAMGVIDEVCITYSESEVIIFPFELLCRLLIHAVDIGERPILRLPDVTVLDPTCLLGEVRTAKDRLDFTWGLYFRSVILRPRPPIIDVILEVPAVNELLYLIFEGDAFLSGITDIFMEPAVLVLVPLGAVFKEWVRLLDQSCLLCS